MAARKTEAAPGKAVLPRLTINCALATRILTGFIRDSISKAGMTRAVIGLSTHTPAEMELARREPADYLAVGPVFDTATKADSAPVISLAGVREARELYRGPLIAIGGISRARIRPVLAAGADAVAVISAVSGASPREIAGRARGLLDAAGSPARGRTEDSVN